MSLQIVYRTSNQDQPSSSEMMNFFSSSDYMWLKGVDALKVLINHFESLQHIRTVMDAHICGLDGTIFPVFSAWYRWKRITQR